jgi:tetratricopeptide (TPR) repeat protein
MVRLGEIAAQRGDDPAASVSDDTDVGVESGASDSTEPAPVDDLPDEDEALAAAVEVERDDATIPAESPGRPSPPPLAAEPEESVAASADEDDPGDLFDLAAELRESMDDDAGEGESGAPLAGAGTEVEGFASLFSEFKKGVSEVLGEGDVETRYDLGIAYKEMGLLDDAIAEFGVCVKSPERRIDSLHMLAVCALEAERAPDAIHHLEQALAGSDLPAIQRAGLLLDLGRSFAVAGDPRRARESYEEALELDPDLPGVSDLIAGLDELPETPAASDDTETYESFDDLIAEVQAETSASEAADAEGTFESFDDVISEVEAGFDEPAAPEAAEPAAEAAVEAAAAPEPDGKKKPRKRKKKISFV